MKKLVAILVLLNVSSAVAAGKEMLSDVETNANHYIVIGQKMTLPKTFSLGAMYTLYDQKVRTSDMNCELKAITDNMDHSYDVGDRYEVSYKNIKPSTLYPGYYTLFMYGESGWHMPAQIRIECTSRDPVLLITTPVSTIEEKLDNHIKFQFSR